MLAPRVQTGRRAAPAAGSPASTAATGTRVSTAAGGGPSPAVPDSSTTCVGSIVDQAGGGCVGASSDPVFGMLYPLGVDLMIQPDGDVGMGTPGPLAQLHVQAAMAAGGLYFPGAVHGDDLIVEAGDAILGVYSNGGGGWGSGVVLGEVHDSPILSKWSMVRETDANGGRLHFTYGTQKEYAENPAVLVLGPGGHAGLGTTDPKYLLQLDRDATSDNAALYISSEGGKPALEIQANHENNFAAYLNGSVRVGNNIGASSVPAQIELDPDAFGSGYFVMRDSAGDIRTSLYAGLDSGGATFQLRDSESDTTIAFSADEDSSGGADLSLYDEAGHRTVEIDAHRAGGGGAILLANSQGVDTVSFDGDSNDAARVVLRDAAGADRIELGHRRQRRRPRDLRRAADQRRRRHRRGLRHRRRRARAGDRGGHRPAARG